MNPLVFTILSWEKELEMQCQLHKVHACAPSAFVSQDRMPRRASRRPFFARLFGIRPQPPCQCP
jgi:hypothetical protein